MAKIAIIIPVWHHPALVDEAVLSCLKQTGAPDFRIIVVNDGCDLRQTRHSLEGWHAAHPDKITLLSQPNLGLSAARNTGIEAALRDPETEAVFFLDADNRLDPHAVALFEKLLKSAPEAGWFYPQLDRFGMEANLGNGGSWALSQLASVNFSDAGSLVRRAVFDSGLRFDTGFRSGFEDWDFWLGAVKRGFIGSPVSTAFFRYRKRPESMVSAAMHKDALLRGQLREKHKWLYATDRLPEAWGQEFPRFALVGSDGMHAVGSDPQAATRLTAADMVAEIFNQRANPGESRFPPMLVFYTPEALADLRRAKLLDSCFYQLEGGLRRSPVVGLTLRQGPLMVRAGPKTVDKTGEMLAECDLIALSLHHLNAALDRGDLEAITGYLLDNLPLLPLRVQIPAPSPRNAGALDPMLALTSALIAHPLLQTPPAQHANWRGQIYAAVTRDVADNNAGGRPALAAKPPGQQVGFVIQVFHFGGSEKCLVALARALDTQGVQCHLFIYGDDQISAADWMFEPFKKIWVLRDPALKDWSAARYLGTGGAGHPGDTLLGDALGPLGQMDVVVNCSAGVLGHGLAGLRQRGVKLAAWEHLTEQTPYGRPIGSPYLSLASEAGYDRILTCSTQLATTLAAHGVPRAKLLPLPNGPGYAATDSAERPAHNGRLRVGFLGRFDPQKQVGRFIEVAETLRDRFDFSVVGGAVLGTAPAFPDWLPVAPPIKSRAGLDGFYAAVDILLMPSRDEGLPLTLLEAQRAGVVVLATDVGAVAEAITDGETGFLLRPESVVADAIATLERLHTDPALLARIARNAAGKPDRWQQNAALFIESLLGA